MRGITTAILAVGWISSAGAQPSSLSHTPRVIVIGIDGLGVEGVARAKMPRLQELMSRAAWTMEARGVMPTLSSPNWASMITGAGTEQHGITSNGYFRRLIEFQPVLRDRAGIFPTIFDALRTQKPASRIAVFHDWAGFADLLEKDAPDVLRHERGAARTVAAAARYWTEYRPDLMFIHLDNVDHAGHEFGWLSSTYLQAAGEADGYIGVIMDMLDRLSASNDTFVLVSSDHGGKGRGHGKNSLEEIQIPWILAGPDVVPGRVARPVYTFDTAATLAWMLGINLSEYAIGRPVLAAFRSPVTLAHRVLPELTELQGRECPTEHTVIPVGSGIVVPPSAYLRRNDPNN